MGDEQILGTAVALFFGGTLIWLIFNALRSGMPDMVSAITILGAGAFVWFIAWVVSSGFVPYGPYALLASCILIFIAMPLAHKMKNRKRRSSQRGPIP